MKNKLVYVASTAHSGSTLLDLTLGTHDNLIGLGEIQSTLNRFKEKQHLCTCGETAENCPIWGDVFYHLNHDANFTVRDAYSVLLNKVSETYSVNHVAVDSSKYLNHLIELNNLKDIDLRILYLLKDVRSFVQSTTKLSKNSSWKGRNPIYRTRQWYSSNRSMLDYLSQDSSKYLQFSYEEFCFDSPAILAEISNFLDIPDFQKNFSNSSDSKSHILRGNAMRFNEKRRAKIQYDFRWFNSLTIQICAHLWPGAMKWNNENVYKRSSIHPNK